MYNRLNLTRPSFPLGSSLVPYMALPFSPKKSLGQHFLTDPNVARKIVGALQASPEEPVVEIGPGTGALTGLLQEAYSNLTAIEVDARAVAYLRAHHPGLDVWQADVLDVDWNVLAEEKGRPLYVISNLPYALTSPILFSLIDHRTSLCQAVLMMQHEVARRLVAGPRTKDYGILSVLTQLYARPALLFRVSRNVFYPKPEVTSAVIRLAFDKPTAPDPGVDPAFLRTVVRAAFNQRRKTLHNSLGRWTRTRAIELPHGWDRRRAEELPPDAFVELARYLQQHS